LAEVLKTNNMKKNSAFQLRSGNKPSPAELSGVSPMKNGSKKAAKALGGSLSKIAKKLKEDKEKKEKKTSPTIPDNVKENLPFINPIGNDKNKIDIKDVPFVGPAPINPDPGGFINTPKQYLTGTKKKKK